MKKILLIGSEGVLGKYFKTKLSNKNNILFLADIKNNTKYSKKNVHHFRLDLRSEKQIKDLFERIHKKFGKIDVLINNAGLTTEGIKNLNIKNLKEENYDSNIWDTTININLKGVFLCTKYFLKYHNNSKKLQKVINIGSIYGSHSPHHEIYKGLNFFSSLAYTTSKSGLIGFTKWLATKYSKQLTTFNIISPAGVYNKQPKKFMKNYLKLIPNNKMAHQKDIFSILNFLVHESTSYLTGQNIHVDGGFSSW